VTQYGILAELLCFYYVVFFFLAIILALTTVDVWLLRRLQQFYPTFYQREKTKVGGLAPSHQM